MAKSPGPALMLAGVAALFLLKGKKGGGTAAKPTFPPADGQLGDSDANVGGGAADGSSTSGGSGGGTSGGTSPQPSNPPPNLSGYPEGYNTMLWASPRNVRDMLSFLGYGVAISDAPLVENAHVKQFQKDYNTTVAHGIANGVKTYEAEGNLSTEGTAGKHTLNGLEIIISKGTPNAGLTDPEIGVSWPAWHKYLQENEA